MELPTSQQFRQQPQLTTTAEGWLQRKEKNKPQSNSVGSALFIFVSGGMNIAWSSGFNDYTNLSYNLYMNLCWFLAATIGSLVGAVLTNKIRKKIFMLISSVLILIGGILFLALHTSFAAIMIARHLNGFAVGFAFVPALVMGGEIVVKYMRGLVTSSVDAMSFALGAFLQILYTACWSSEINANFDANQMHGLLCLIFSTISLTFAHFMIIESPVFLLLLGQEEAAIDTLRRLQLPAVITYETYQQLEEHKRYIAVSKAKTMSQSFVDSVPALIKLCIFRALVAMSFSLIVNFTLRTTSFNILHNLTAWPYIIFATSRWIGSLAGIFMMDSVGRKKPLNISMLICSAMAIGVGVIYCDVHKLTRSTQMIIAIVFLIIHQLFAGVAVTSSSAYLSEGFPLAAKPYCIAMVFSAEMLVHIIIGSIYLQSTSISDYFYVLGAFSLLFIAFSILCLPETKNTSLFEAQFIFRGFSNRGFS